LIIGSLLNQYKNLTIIGEEGVTDVSQIPGHLIINQYCQKFLDQHKCPKSFENISESEIDQFVIWVDPLDGTSEYVLGMVENVTVLIGIAFNEISIGGVVHQPFFKCPKTNKIGRTIWGLKGLGSGGFDKKSAPEKKLILTTMKSLIQLLNH
jgi:3'(2'), 5'-bisphosphate nucleotidase